jgi:hypothetical protein
MHLSYRHCPGVYPPELRDAIGRLIMTWAEIEHQLMTMLQMALLAKGSTPDTKLKIPGIAKRIEYLLKIEELLHKGEENFQKAFADFISDVISLKDKREATAHGISCLIDQGGQSVAGFVRHDLFGRNGTRPEVFSVGDINAAADRAFELLQEAHDWSSEFAYLQMRNAKNTKFFDHRIGWYRPDQVWRNRTPRRVVTA